MQSIETFTTYNTIQGWMELQQLYVHDSRSRGWSNWREKVWSFGKRETLYSVGMNASIFLSDASSRDEHFAYPYFEFNGTLRFRKRISSSIGNDQSAIHITSKQENNWRKRPQTIRFSKQNIWNKIMDLWMHKNKNGKIKHQKHPLLLKKTTYITLMLNTNWFLVRW